MECAVCRKESRIIPEKSSLALECGHMIQCTECRDYNLEKLMRCEKCCTEILGFFVGGCSPSCLRHTSTVKASALCAICGSHLRKEARCCRSSDTLKKCKHQLRTTVTVLVQRPTLIKNPSPKDRPCSHYTLCQHCKKNVTKGHRSSTSCKICKNTNKRPAIVMESGIKEKDKIYPEPKKRCLLQTLADAVNTEMNDLPPVTKAENSPLPSINHKTPTTHQSPESTETLTSSTTTPPSTVYADGRYGKCGIPIWALVNHSPVQLNTPGKFFPNSKS